MKTLYKKFIRDKKPQINDLDGYKIGGCDNWEMHRLFPVHK